MTNMHDRQLEHDLDQLGLTLTERAPAELPDGLASAMARKRRVIVVRRAALAAAVLLVAGGAFVVYLAASVWTSPAPHDRIADPRRTLPHLAPPDEPLPTAAPASIASLTGTWQRTGDIDLPPAPRHDAEPPFRAGDGVDRAKVEAVSGPLR